jgi:hypothetical protein
MAQLIKEWYIGDIRDGDRHDIRELLLQRGFTEAEELAGYSAGKLLRQYGKAITETPFAAWQVDKLDQALKQLGLAGLADMPQD